MQGYWKTSELEGENAAYLEMLYETYLDDPNSVDPSWKAYFDNIQDPEKTRHSDVRASFIELAQHPHCGGGAGDAPAEAYRKKGHLLSKIDPLGLTTYPKPEDLGLDPSLIAMQKIYCGSVGYEFMHIQNDETREWLRQKIETPQAPLSAEQKKWLLERLIAVDGIEKYLGTKYVGQKRFSLEGGDSFIPLMNELIRSVGIMGAKTVVIGMAHRGRLNVLVNVMGKAPKTLFEEFEGKHSLDLLAGDVKYHNGFSSDIELASGPIHLALAFNPSHLEIVSPVVDGSVHARLKQRHDHNQDEVLAIQVHGDAAFAGQGCVYESLNMAQIEGFNNGGAIHIIINNQVGFTTGPAHARSTHYCTDIAKAFDIPVFHVNGHDPEAVFKVAQLAAQYRHTFKKDVFIDLLCYRRHGHNEADEPSGTQPLMYQVIKNLPVPAKIYAEKLISEQVIADADYLTIQQNYKKSLDAGHPVVELMAESKKTKNQFWKKIAKNSWDVTYKSTLPKAELVRLGKALDQRPEGFTLQMQVGKTIHDRVRMLEGEIPFNWGAAEIMAYATLVANGVPVRLCGEDTGRGTFAHRHSVLKDQQTGECYVPLQHVKKDQAEFEIIDSILSEESVLAFEYGYAGSTAEGLTIWEAQFGDFVNGAQVIIDQFISAAEEKWGKLCSLTMLLPHGQEGMGPEHSSARLERFLQLCAHDNIQVCAPTTPAQIYHLLRRQALRAYRKPLIIMSPKSLLRHPMLASSLEDLAEGTFLPVIGETDKISATKVRRVIFCQGKVYYDLLTMRREKKIEDIAILRLEQIYPFPQKDAAKLLKSFSQVKDFVWCQEEPHNQGAWFKVRDDFRALGFEFRYVGREAYASPAVGYASIDKQQQNRLVEEALS